LRSHRLNPSERTKWGFDAHQTDEILESIAFDLNVAAQLKASFVTDRRIHIDLLERISGDDQLRRRNEILEKHLTTIVPFVNELSPTELLKLRYVEGDAFDSYCKLLNTSFYSYFIHTDEFIEHNAIAHVDEI